MAEQELPTKHCWDCGKTEDLAQCPDCHGWFCGKHNVHLCGMPDPKSAQRKRYAAIDRRAWFGFAMMFASVEVAFGTLVVVVVAIEYWAWDTFGGLILAMTFVTVALAVLGYSICRHYDRQLKQFNVHGFPIETAKKDR